MDLQPFHASPTSLGEGDRRNVPEQSTSFVMRKSPPTPVQCSEFGTDVRFWQSCAAVAFLRSRSGSRRRSRTEGSDTAIGSSNDALGSFGHASEECLAEF